MEIALIGGSKVEKFFLSIWGWGRKSHERSFDGD
jgi:hypothetical protein